MFAAAQEIRSEWVLSVKGKVRERLPGKHNPKLTTGAGDNFNCGFCIGLLAGLEPAELLAAGTASSGFYVRNGRSATNAELSGFLEAWAAHYGDPNF